jgi:DNA polymerase I
MEVEVALLTGDYVADEPPMLRFFGRTRDGQSVLVVNTTFQPYFHLIEKSWDPAGTQRMVEMIEREKTVREIHELNEGLIVGRNRKRAWKVVMKGPWMVPEIRNKIREAGFMVGAADIPYHLRYLWEFQIGGCTLVRGEEDPDLASKYGVDIALEVK